MELVHYLLGAFEEGDSGSKFVLFDCCKDVHALLSFSRMAIEK